MRAGVVMLFVVPTAMGALASDSKVGADCSFNGKRLYGKVQRVNAFANVKVQVVNAFPGRP